MKNKKRYIAIIIAIFIVSAIGYRLITTKGSDFAEQTPNPELCEDKLKELQPENTDAPYTDINDSTNNSNNSDTESSNTTQNNNDSYSNSDDYEDDSDDYKDDSDDYEKDTSSEDKEDTPEGDSDTTEDILDSLISDGDPYNVDDVEVEEGANEEISDSMIVPNERKKHRR